MIDWTQTDRATYGNAKFELADSLANCLLSGVVDKDNIPIIYHCRSVFFRCQNLSDDQRLAAILHECIEDGKLPHGDPVDSYFIIQKMIQMMFGDCVYWCVKALTRDDGTTYMDYIKRIVNMSLIAVPVKLADLADNLSRCGCGGSDCPRCKRYQKACKYLEDFSLTPIHRIEWDHLK